MICRGDLYLADLNPTFGTEPGKIRPVVIIQSDDMNQARPSSTVICPITTRVLPKSKITRLNLHAGRNGLDKDSDVLVDQVRAIDNRRFVHKIGELSANEIQELNARLRIILGLY